MADNPQALATAFGSVLTLTAVGTTSYFNYTSNEYWRKKEDADKDVTKYLHSLEELNQLRQELRYQIYSEPHRKVSVATRILKTIEEPGSKLNINKEFFEKLKLSKNQNLLDKNDYRSMCRDNMANIRSIMEQYVEKRPIVSNLAKKTKLDFNHKLLTEGDAERLKRRFTRFKEAVQKMDEGYPDNKDDDLYNQKSFDTLVDGCKGKSIVLK